MNPKKQSIFVTDDGQNLVFTFILVSSLFLLWGFCNGMIDVMDKHFQEELSLSKSQSAWVQFAHYLGYFLMSLPAGVLASKLGYKGGIIAGLLLSFARALGEFGATIMIAGNIPGKTQTLSMAIYDASQSGQDDLALLLVIITSALSITVLLLSNRFFSLK